MERIGNIDGVPISVPFDASLSFYNSPYTGHAQSAAVDVYPPNEEWGYLGVSPVSGTITRIRKMKMGRKKSFKTHEFDYGIGIVPFECSEYIVRILHCLPDVKEGEEIEIGDPIGTLLRSRFFNFWTSPHYHIEMMHKTDFIRSTKSIEFNYLEGEKQLVIHKGESIFSAEWEITRVTDDYIQISSDNAAFGTIRNHIGNLIDVGQKNGIIDAGIPHYRHGGAHGVNGEVGDSISIRNLTIGSVTKAAMNSVVFTQRKIPTLKVNGAPIRGFSSYLYNERVFKKPSLKVIPLSRGISREYMEGDFAFIEPS